MGLGSTRILGLAEARERAIEARQQLLTGADPIEERKKKRVAAEVEAARAITFRQAAEQFMAQRVGKNWGDKNAEAWAQTFRDYAFPVIGHLPVSAIDTPLVVRCLEPNWSTKTDTMGRLANRIESVLEWSTVRGYREGDNPAARKRLKYALPERPAHNVRSHPDLPAEQVPRLMAQLAGIDDMAARALRFLILTAARTKEIRLAVWTEIDMEDTAWVIPAERMKMKRDHRVPLSKPALDVLAECAAMRESERIFPGQRFSFDPLGAPINSGAMRSLMVQLSPGFTPHGLRATFKSWAKKHRYRFDLHEAALAHQVGSVVERLYDRETLFDERRELMDAWGRHCTGQPTGQPAQIVPLRRK